VTKKVASIRIKAETPSTISSGSRQVHSEASIGNDKKGEGLLVSGIKAVLGKGNNSTPRKTVRDRER